MIELQLVLDGEVLLVLIPAHLAKLVQLDGVLMLEEEHASDQFQSALVLRSIQLMDIHAFHAQETTSFQEPTTRFVFQLHVQETPS